ncbi:MAG: hypothetical protein N4A72_17185 [Bacteroidales bacterium]|jgi:septation ring formation regulator EzrA|nr:hypothetical protein [Bacteroidales bacterium]
MEKYFIVVAILLIVAVAATIYTRKANKKRLDDMHKRRKLFK